MTPIIEWIKKGWHPEEAKRWSKVFKTPAEARPWFLLGFYPTEAYMWFKAGFTPEEASKWKKSGFKSSTEASKWRKEGFKPREAYKWSSYGFEPRHAVEFKKHKYSPEEALRYKTAQQNLLYLIIFHLSRLFRDYFQKHFAQEFIKINVDEALKELNELYDRAKKLYSFHSKRYPILPSSFTFFFEIPFRNALRGLLSPILTNILEFLKMIPSLPQERKNLLSPELYSFITMKRLVIEIGRIWTRNRFNERMNFYLETGKIKAIVGYFEELHKKLGRAKLSSLWMEFLAKKIQQILPKQFELILQVFVLGIRRPHIKVYFEEPIIRKIIEMIHGNKRQDLLPILEKYRKKIVEEVKYPEELKLFLEEGKLLEFGEIYVEPFEEEREFIDYVRSYRKLFEEAGISIRKYLTTWITFEDIGTACALLFDNALEEFKKHLNEGKRPETFIITYLPPETNSLLVDTLRFYVMAEKELQSETMKAIKSGIPKKEATSNLEAELELLRARSIGLIYKNLVEILEDLLNAGYGSKLLCDFYSKSFTESLKSLSLFQWLVRYRLNLGDFLSRSYVFENYYDTVKKALTIYYQTVPLLRYYVVFSRSRLNPILQPIYDFKTPRVRRPSRKLLLEPLQKIHIGRYMKKVIKATPYEVSYIPVDIIVRIYGNLLKSVEANIRTYLRRVEKFLKRKQLPDSLKDFEMFLELFLIIATNTYYLIYNAFTKFDFIQVNMMPFKRFEYFNKILSNLTKFSKDELDFVLSKVYNEFVKFVEDYARASFMKTEMKKSEIKK
jgi:hypothetical protein